MTYRRILLVLEGHYCMGTALNETDHCWEDRVSLEILSDDLWKDG